MSGDQHTEHGFEIARFSKPGQTIRIMKDGCLLVEISYTLMSGKTGHTLPEYRDSPEARKRLLESGFEEDL